MDGIRGRGECRGRGRVAGAAGSNTSGGHGQAWWKAAVAVTLGEGGRGPTPILVAADRGGHESGRQRQLDGRRLRYTLRQAMMSFAGGGNGRGRASNAGTRSGRQGRALDAVSAARGMSAAARTRSDE